MRTIITISGTTGSIMLIISLISKLYEHPYNKQFLTGGLILIIGITLPLLIIDKIRNKRKIDKIINTYKNSQKKKTSKISKGDAITKGWGMNNSPFRDRKSGVTWGGGNIKGANASRGTRKSFLK